MTMTKDQRDALAHIVVDPDDWYATAIRHHGAALAAQFLADKAARWAPVMAAEKARVGAAYKNRAQRDAEEAKLEAARQVDIAKRRDEAKLEEERRFDAAVKKALDAINKRP